MVLQSLRASPLKKKTYRESFLPILFHSIPSQARACRAFLLRPSSEGLLRPRIPGAKKAPHALAPHLPSRTADGIDLPRCLLPSYRRCLMRAIQRFGQQLQRLRTRRGLTQEQLAVKAGLVRVYVTKLEQGEHDPTLTMLVRLQRCSYGAKSSARRASTCARAASSTLPRHLINRLLSTVLIRSRTIWPDFPLNRTCTRVG